MAVVGTISVLIVALGGEIAHAESTSRVPDVAKSVLAGAVTNRGLVGNRLNSRQAVRIAKRDSKLDRYLKRFKHIRASAYVKTPGEWQVSFYFQGNEVARVVVDDTQRAVAEVWTGPQVAWTMARGIEGAFGRKVTKPWVWIPLMVLFFTPFFNLRKPLRLFHLDLIVLLLFSLSHFYFNKGEIFTSVPLVYPTMGYLLIRMLMVGFGRARSEVNLLVPVSWLVLAVIFLVGFRVGLNLVNSNVIDVGYAGVIGADRVVHGESLYGGFPNDNPSGDTYGPVAYYAYVPFELAFPWHGKWDNLPASHAAALFFDIATLVLLFLLGRRLKPGDQGRRLGVTLAYVWATYPYTLFVLNSNTNDSLVALLLVAGFLACTSAPLRGIFLALATATKFAPLALVPLWGSFPRLWNRPRDKVWFTVSFGVVLLIVMLPVLLGSQLGLFWKRTVGFQLERSSPFSIWGQHPIRLGVVQDAVMVAAAGLALLVAFVPKRRNPVQLAALTAALLIATQLSITHWFYLYVVWFFPFVMIALLGGGIGEPAWGRRNIFSGAPLDPDPGSVRAQSGP